MTLRFKQFLEAFDTISDFLLNPDHRNKTFQELEKEFTASGGQILGMGKYGVTYSHPSWKYILKTFYDDNCYLKFARYASRNPHKALPVFYGPPQRIVPEFTRDRSQTYLYVVRLEKLNPVRDKDLLGTFVNTYSSGPSYINADKPDDSPWIKNMEYAAQKYPKLIPVWEAIGIMNKIDWQCSPDVNPNNLMQRDNGDLVLIDPFWYGTNPYMDAMQARQMEIGYDGWDEPDPKNQLIGGRTSNRPRNKSKPKRVEPTYDDNDNIPF